MIKLDKVQRRYTIQGKIKNFNFKINRKIKKNMKVYKKSKKFDKSKIQNIEKIKKIKKKFLCEKIFPQ